MGLVIAGERSGVGKTTVTLALLAALRQQQDIVQSFKVGPDYIDPMFHRYVTERYCYNLDPVLTSESYIRECYARHAQTSAYALVEGVMGLFDGASGDDDWASTAHIARLLDLPVLLVLDCSRLSRSVAAIAHGYRTFAPRLKLAGVVLNRVGGDRHLDLLKTALASIDIPILGILHRQDRITIPDRHLGLVPTAELPELDVIIYQLAELGKTCFDWDRLRPLLAADRREGGYGGNGVDREAGEAGGAEREERDGEAREAKPSTINHQPIQNPKSKIQNPKSKIRLAVARDRAFNFYYPDNLLLLEHLGAELVFWSPLEDGRLPEDIQGFYFGGGFPELFAEGLAGNQRVVRQVKSAIRAGMPTYAECGGLMYLSQQIIDFANTAWPMAGVLPCQIKMDQRLTLGYRQATALQNSPLISAGETVWGHEFHRSTLCPLSKQPLYQIQGYGPNRTKESEGWRVYQVHASYVHLHWGANPDMPKRFLTACDCSAQ